MRMWQMVAILGIALLGSAVAFGATHVRVGSEIFGSRT